MSVGIQPTKASMDNNLTQLAVTMRNLMTQVQNEWTAVNNGASGTPVQVLTAMGYNNTNSDAPGNQSDAAYADYVLNTLNTLAQVYFGNATQGTDFDFNNALALLWAGQY
jgi:hypothetical protein